jgi:hypothetical protein
MIALAALGEPAAAIAAFGPHISQAQRDDLRAFVDAGRGDRNAPPARRLACVLAAARDGVATNLLIAEAQCRIAAGEGWIATDPARPIVASFPAFLGQACAPLAIRSALT